MNKKFIWGAFAAASLSLASCSQDEVVEQNDQKPTPEVSIENGFKELGTFAVKTELGDQNDSFAESKSPEDIDYLGRPIGVYPLNKVGLLKLTPGVQPTAADVNHNIDMKYGTEPEFMFHEIPNAYKIYYKLNITENNIAQGASNSGTITLCTKKDGSDAITFDLTVFKLADLHNTDENFHIKLNDFAYGKTSGNLRGSTLRYTSYDPKDIKDYNGDASQNPEHLTGKYVTLPEVPSSVGLDFLKGEYAVNNRLVEECGDIYFAGAETLIAADDDKVYFLESVLEENAAGGHYIKTTYPSPEGHTDVPSLNMSRFTSIVNASFMIIDKQEWGPSSYFKENNEAATLKNFKNKYGVDLSGMTCPYATFDGVNTRFYANEMVNEDKSTDRARLLLWAEDGRTRYAANGAEVHKTGVTSMDLNFNDDGILKRGYGIKGNSYSVIFQGSQADTRSQQINFYATVDGVNILITATIDAKTGIAFSKNVAHNVMVFVPATRFANFVKDQKKLQARGSRAAQDYAVFEVPSDCVQVK